jgi:putative sterol carrier protein
VIEQIDPTAAPGASIEWEFTDAEPWHLRIDHGSTAVAAGRVERPDLTFRCRLRDWVDIAAGRADPVRALLTGRVRPRGSLRMLARTPKLFG